MSGRSGPDGEPDPLALDRQLCFQFYAASNLIIRLYRPVLNELGLTYPQYLAMLVLWERDGISVGDICARLYLDSGTVTPMLKRMESLGLVERSRDLADERRVLVMLTDEGRALRSRAISVPEIMSQGQDPDDLNELREVVSEIVKSLARA
jgi:MarR family transcriptional regulator, organic hydroperoxide resistance regulator